MSKPHHKQLLKGLEEEVYTGTLDGEIVGLSNQIADEMDGYATEPDARNVEHTTDPTRDYDLLLQQLMHKRRLLRQWLTQHGDYTLVPGATISLGDADTFHISRPENPYYQYIRKTYGTNVVTASTHINVGIPDTEMLIRATRVIRCEAALWLALSATSPFLGGRATGFHSTRWRIFPHTPSDVPLFLSHAHYVGYVQAQLMTGVMRNIRHLWSSVRPNGTEAPEHVQRLELRICDRVACPDELMALTALLEARIWQVIEDDELDPMRRSTLSPCTRAEQLRRIADENEQAVTVNSLDAELRHWRDGKPIKAREWVEQLLEEVRPTAKAHGFCCGLDPLERLLTTGSVAQRWLADHAAGQSVQQIIHDAAEHAAEVDAVQKDTVC
ncbi:glutamate--cysteine ligase [Planctomycetales bacterium ZRK34]|nr:glutamate--cysteine ligase [Planctomycetales bacterium ZRK34]